MLRGSGPFLVCTIRTYGLTVCSTGLERDPGLGVELGSGVGAALGADVGVGPAGVGTGAAPDLPNTRPFIVFAAVSINVHPTVLIISAPRLSSVNTHLPALLIPCQTPSRDS
jgi:hypothetical protein